MQAAVPIEKKKPIPNNVINFDCDKATKEIRYNDYIIKDTYVYPSYTYDSESEFESRSTTTTTNTMLHSHNELPM